ncbi:prolyl oligopeptidase family serine peptidase [Kocuria rhizophila]|nr:prolyl oligopeptidase family serine peptidase [Kocuria rhizophila]
MIDGDKDYRVPISQGIELWADLQQRTAVEGHRFLYYPDEGTRILKPANARTWYETVLAFVGEHVLGRSRSCPSCWAERERSSRACGVGEGAESPRFPSASTCEETRARRKHRPARRSAQRGHRGPR